MQLSKVVGAILNDLSEAQDLANEYSSQLSRKYQKNRDTDTDDNDNVLTNSEVPSALIKEISLDLKFIINDIKSDGFTIDVDKTQENCRKIAETIVKELIPKINKTIKTLINKANKFSTDNLDPARVTKNIVTPEFRNRLESISYLDLFRLCHRTFMSENDLSESEIKNSITKKLEDELFKQENIKILLEVEEPDNPQEVKLVKDTKEQFQEDCLSSVDAALQEINDIQTVIQKIKGTPKTEVIINPRVLMKVPKEVIQSLQITAKYDDYKWTIWGVG
ncbi:MULTISPECIES: hypothetical protein [Okeania]|uniref:Uncharacterized protein n=1 Tax=Okeania hirsuta TaxID=1458930 RepID=A0A3N6RN85_9CYAN|nr:MULTISPECIES: hypothetical protein [Okeania]NES92028.1 hypothetical protein [Okeania sp. SIO2B9]RQH40804.1 hypothetical protein D5R40_16175 [Okeania hirsuta]